MNYNKFPLFLLVILVFSNGNLDRSRNYSGVIYLNNSFGEVPLPYCTIRLIKPSSVLGEKDYTVKEICADDRGRFNFTIHDIRKFNGQLEFEYENVIHDFRYINKRVKSNLGIITLKPKVRELPCYNHKLSEKKTCWVCKGLGSVFRQGGGSSSEKCLRCGGDGTEISCRTCDGIDELSGTIEKELKVRFRHLPAKDCKN